MAVLNYDPAKNRDEGALAMPYGIQVAKLTSIKFGTSTKKGTEYFQVRFTRINEAGALEEALATFYVTDGTLKNETLNPVTNLNHILNKIVDEAVIQKAFDSSDTLQALADNLEKIVNKLPEEKRYMKVLVLNAHNEDKTQVYPSVGPRRPYTDAADGSKLVFDPTQLLKPQEKVEKKSTQQGFAQPGSKAANGSPVTAGATAQFDDDDEN